MKFDVKNLKLADAGRKKIEWAAKEMPVLATIREEFAKKKPLKNLKIGACLHVTAETANLMIALKAGGAKLALCASNPLSTQDDVAASLVQHFKIPVFARRGENRKVYYQHLSAVLDTKPNVTMDDGADLVSLLHTEREKLAKEIWGSSEETTTGVIRLKSLAKSGKLKFPVIAVNDSKTKHMFDNRYGTGQSTIDGIVRATNILLAGKRFVIAGYGWCGRGLANRARGMGAHVIVTEIDPIRALEARMDGFEVMPMEKAALVGDIFVTATGNVNVIDLGIFERMKNSTIVANTGHFDVEINVKALEKLAREKKQIRTEMVEYKINKEKSIYLLAQGRLVNLAAAEGHPAAVMDMSFAGQAFAAQYIAQNRRKLKKQVYALPEEIDQRIAILKLEAMSIKIDELTPEQTNYLSSWELGT
ncbi:MAG: adenosylhomocysteinase [Candidatus Doudnabacteria bacterium RIFCSPHIGHO2_02_FULL_48_21]|uniref:Adenosylhomocysteinase n=1 Tax=Candidatus Doudnabacteria bacterium RIFCSPLOWO2_02_FULL_48_13 TaxID=1817845 RepID=A0A1F5Q8F9_9BACT|nr:MAG: adenosylhomocysteinase [Candidatus Doudnabacteria bacterium RIFCSPHIGHO2_01_48_18]OGE79878.1 MAG: adenosylhomocysteinase [Candidatus Doudnabacteria bacterium RIFCSPHIGHO2_01_FULL_48_180]OGE91055.1 MAG: adenosylhomocysteinase [Candidatus Doudnabacteria bacterium RIFCSPHIGHO2_12_FULL_47_25]OGE94041.1 MAG: adenosylhomocysteinase [Candidatus Doudnabacteria bacterium RIFCSPHIGHO2_02_FULL_48_21]OGE98053.1 MAG: adenosylhomocysteinase [Candidatus Doudnabacteria bacterium RIFCSPLOWO2_01_FULL_48_